MIDHEGFGYGVLLRRCYIKWRETLIYVTGTELRWMISLMNIVLYKEPEKDN